MFDKEAFSERLTDLVNKKDITKDTAATYLSCIRVLSNIENTDLMAAVKEVSKDKRQLRKYINAIRKYESIVTEKQFSILNEPAEGMLMDEYNKKPLPKNKVREFDNDKYMRKINGIHDLRTRLTLRLQVQSGLRVSELSKLKPEDITFDDGKIIINVVEGKGRKQRVVKVRDDPYLYEKLQEYIKDNENEKLFNSRRDIKEKAAKRGIETHDLRRINARMRLEDEKKEGKNFKQAREIVQDELGHSFPATTDIYLGRKRGKANE